MTSEEHNGLSSNAGRAEVAVRPPVLFLAGFAAGCLLELLAPIGPGLANGAARPFWIGLALAAIGAGIAVKAIRQFAEAGTSVALDEPTDALVTSGLYGLSRNPIYTGLGTLYVGLSIALTTGWALLIFPFLIMVLRKGVIESEEAYLAAEFGRQYEDYKAKVPRWL